MAAPLFVIRKLRLQRGAFGLKRHANVLHGVEGPLGAEIQLTALPIRLLTSRIRLIEPLPRTVQPEM